MEPITHDTIPKALTFLIHEVSELKLLLRKKDEQPEQEKEEFITIKQVCELTGYAAPSIYAMIGKKTIPYIKRGHRVIFERALIIKWLREGTSRTKEQIEASADRRISNKR